MKETKKIRVKKDEISISTELTATMPLKYKTSIDLVCPVNIGGGIFCDDVNKMIHDLKPGDKFEIEIVDDKPVMEPTWRWEYINVNNEQFINIWCGQLIDETISLEEIINLYMKHKIDTHKKVKMAVTRATEMMNDKTVWSWKFVIGQNEWDVCIYKDGIAVKQMSGCSFVNKYIENEYGKD